MARGSREGSREERPVDTGRRHRLILSSLPLDQLSAAGEQLAYSAQSFEVGSADPFARFRDHFRAMLEMVRRPVLVVIDDIDRCEPKFIVGMTRGLQTILKSPRVVYLLLGDRKWIEQAFDVFHTDMKDIDVGAEHTFGGRFVEKAIQLSYVLPAMGAQKERYVRDVLTGRWSVEADRAKIREDLSNPVKASAIDEIADAKLENDPDGGETQRVVREEVILSRAANKEVVEQEIRHRLQPLARFLPDNPRHVKRIINAISMYQNSIVLTEDYETARFGGEMWRRLVVGVVAMIGFSRSWSILARDPDLATCLLQREPPADSTEGLRQQNYEMLSRNETFRKLLAETELWEDDPDVRVETRIDAEAVRWLTSVIPAAG